MMQTNATICLHTTLYFLLATFRDFKPWQKSSTDPLYLLGIHSAITSNESLNTVKLTIQSPYTCIIIQ